MSKTTKEVWDRYWQNKWDKEKGRDKDKPKGKSRYPYKTRMYCM